MKKEKTSDVPEVSFIIQLLTNKWFLAGIGGLLVFVLLPLIYIYNPKLAPALVKSTVETLGDNILGEDLAEKIDETRDENGATSIRLIFNDNKEENLEKHCEKKEENGQVQEKCFKTYENEEFGYSVEIPENYVTQETDLGTKIIEDKYIDKQSDYPLININVYQNPDRDTAYNWVVKNSSLFIGEQTPEEVEGFTSSKDVKVKDLKGISLEWDSMGAVKDTVLEKDDKIIVLEFSTPSSLELAGDSKTVYEQIVASLKL